MKEKQQRTDVEKTNKMKNDKVIWLFTRSILRKDNANIYIFIHFFVCEIRPSEGEEKKQIRTVMGEISSRLPWDDFIDEESKSRRIRSVCLSDH